MCLLKEAQFDELTVSLERKIIHGVFFKQCQEEGWDTLGSHAWLLDGRVQVRTEAMIMAVQDGVILTRAFRSRVMGRAIFPACCVCKGASETISHILSAVHPCSGRFTRRNTTKYCIRSFAYLPPSST